MKKLFTQQLLAAVVLLGSAGAQAAMITQWNVNVNSFFDTSSIVWDHSNGGPSTVVTSTSKLIWGNPTTSPSSLAIGSSPANTFVNTNGPAVNNITLTHTNNPITGTTLDSVTLLSTLTLTPSIPSSSGLSPVTQDFVINFQETTNDPRPGLCADGGTYGVGVNVNGCADIFVISQSSLNFAFDYYDIDDAINRTYYISFFEATNGLDALSSAACVAAGATSPCLGFETRENAITVAQFAALVTSEPVSIPEPGTLALFGIALAGFGVTGLKRRRNI